MAHGSRWCPKAGSMGHNWSMSYFTATVAQHGDNFRTIDVDVEEWSTLDDLAQALRAASGEDCEALAVVEREDEWFAMIRLTQTDDVKVFISDLVAAQASPYADVLEDYLDSPLDEYELEDGDDFDDDFDDEDEAENTEDEPTMFESEDAQWGGDADIYADYGVGANELLDQCDKHSADPARVVAHVGEKVGFADVLEAAR